MLVRLPVAILSFPLLLQVAATEVAKWVLSEKSADCDLACSGEGLSCDKDANAAKIIDDLSTQSSYEALLATFSLTGGDGDSFSLTCGRYVSYDMSTSPSVYWNPTLTSPTSRVCLNPAHPAEFTCSGKETDYERMCWCTPGKTPTTGAKPKNAKYYGKKAVKYWRRFFDKRVKKTMTPSS